MSQYHFIYKTTNLINNKIYIGKHSTNDLNDGYLGSGMLLKKAVKKYGKKNFSKEILFFFDSADEALTEEAKIVTPEFVTNQDNYNMMVGGDCGPNHQGKTYEEIMGVKKAELLKIQRSEQLKQRHLQTDTTGANNSNYGNKWSSEQREHLSTVRISRGMGKGENNPNFGNGWKNSGNKNSSFGKKWVHRKLNDDIWERKYIIKDELEMYLNNGWIAGAGPKGKQYEKII